MSQPNWLQMGADASGLELRVLAHYMARYDDGAFAKSVLSEKPNDVHTLNANALGVSRDDGKTFIYAFLYGAGDLKLGKTIAKGKSEEQQTKIGAEAKKKFLRTVPALGYVLEAIREKVKKDGYLLLIDGRRCYIRSEHAALNSLIQGTGAIICKRWIVEYNRRFISAFGPQGWLGQWAALGWIHDEVQLAVRPAIQQQASEIILASIRHMTEHFSFRCPLDGEVKFGRNWKDTH